MNNNDDIIKSHELNFYLPKYIIKYTSKILMNPITNESKKILGLYNTAENTVLVPSSPLHLFRLAEAFWKCLPCVNDASFAAV